MVGTATRLHLVGRLGFDISDKAVKRAGLDYWENLDLVRHESFKDLLDQVADPKRVFYFSKKAAKSFFDVQWQRGDYLVFGKETVGLDEKLLRENDDRCVRIPMWGPIRSLNLANSVTAVIYEGMRQLIASGQIPR